jgi:uncharacterized delta-60 repeat protein
MRTWISILSFLVAAAVQVPAQRAGDLDVGFGQGGYVLTDFGGNDTGQAIALQPDGKILVAGWTYHGTSNFAVARYLPNGGLDTAFGSGGGVAIDIGVEDRAWAVALQPDDRIVLASESAGRFAVARLTREGALDKSFGSGGTTTTVVTGPLDGGRALAMQLDGKIVVAGFAGGSFAVVRYLPDGTLDSTFGSKGKAVKDIGSGPEHTNAVLIQQDGKIVLAGEVADGDNYVVALARYISGGALDGSFGSAGVVVTRLPKASGAVAATLAPDGSILVAGYHGGDMLRLRYDSRGVNNQAYSFTLNFGGNNAEGHAIGLKADGKLLVARDVNYNVFLARWNRDGRMDVSFGNQGVAVTDLGRDEFGNGLAVLPDGKILVAGRAAPDFLLLRYGGGPGAGQ